MSVIQVLAKATMITSFVTVMMIVIEYVEARFGHSWTQRLGDRGAAPLAPGF